MVSAAVAAVIEVVGAVVAAGAEAEAGDKQTAAIRTKQNQERVAASQRTQQRVRRTEQIMGQQTVEAAAKGLSGAGTSMKVLTLDTLGAFNDDEHADALNLSFTEKELDEKVDISRAKTAGDIFGTFGQLGSELAKK